MTKPDSGLSVRQISESAFNVFRNALGHKDHWGQPLATWDNVDLDAQDGWIAACQHGVDEIEGAEDLSWKDLAKHIYGAWAKAMGYDFDFEHAYHETRHAWNAVARHIANLLAIEDHEDLKQHEDHWMNYSEKQLAKEA